MKEDLNKILIDEKLDNFNIEIKHGCTEYYNSFPKFKKINFNGKQELDYNKDWQEKKIQLTMKNQSDLKITKNLGAKCKRNNLSDILIIKIG